MWEDEWSKFMAIDSFMIQIIKAVNVFESQSQEEKRTKIRYLATEETQYIFHKILIRFMKHNPPSRSTSAEQKS